MTLLRLIPASATHRGMRRKHNEDAIGYRYPSDIETLRSYGALFIVADGVGGLSAGDEASQMTVEKLIEYYYASDVSLSVEQRLAEAIQDVNTDVFTALRREGATTLVTVVIIEDRLIAASAGDSQIFRIADGTITQINEEDVLHSGDADDGALTKAVGYRENIEIETISGTIKPADRILLCSDGLTRYLKHPQIRQLAGSRDSRDSVRRMINQANTAGGADNISVTLINIGEAINDDDIAAHIKNISVRVAVDDLPMMMQDVPSKPTTQIPLSRPVTSIDESLLETPELPEHIKQNAVQTTKKVSPAVSQVQQSTQSNTMIMIIIAAVAILAIGAVILGIALASPGDNGNSGDVTPEVTSESATIENIPSATVSGADIEISTEIQIDDIIVLDESVLTQFNIGSDVASFLATAGVTYQINNITQDSEGQLWYLLLEDETNQTGWVAESNMPAYSIQSD